MTDDYLDELLDELVSTQPREAWDDVVGRARRSRRRYAAAVAIVAMLVLAPSAWAIRHALSTKHYVPSYAPRTEQVIDLSWLSPRRGWALLGLTCGRARSRCAAVQETRDGGASWQQLASIPAEIGAGSNGALSGTGFCSPRRLCVAHVLFVTSRIGYAYGPSLFMTTNGGRSWNHVSAQPVESMASSGSVVYRIVYAHAGCPGPCSPSLEESTAGTRAWTQLSVPQPAGSGTGETVYAAGRNVYVFAWGNIAGGVTSQAGIEVSRDTGQTWSTIPDPCGSAAHGEWDASAASATGDLLGVLCLPRQGGPAFVALSRNAGRTFVDGTRVDFHAAEQIAISSSGAVAVGNAGVTGGGPFTYDLYLSRDGGHTWRVAVHDRERAAIDLAGGFLQFVSPRELLWVGYPYSVWASTDTGRTWSKRQPAPNRSSG